MPLARSEAHEVTRQFIRIYPGALALAYKFRENTAELYGPRAAEAPPDMKGGYLPKETAHAGRTYRGRVDVPLENIADARDLLLTLRHEVLGHYGANTFTPGGKRALLDGLIAAREEPSLRPLWDDIDVRYAGRSLDVRAEEVYSLQCEGVEPSHHIGTDQAQRGQQAFRETCVTPVRLMRADDLQSIACMVAQGLHDRSRSQQCFPTANELQKREGINVEPKKPIQETAAAAPASHDKAVENVDDQRVSMGAVPQEIESAQLRARLKGVEGVAAEDTRSELLQHAAQAAHKEREEREANTRLAAQTAADAIAPKPRNATLDGAPQSAAPNHYGPEALELHAKELAARYAAGEDAATPPPLDLREELAKAAAERQARVDAAGASEAVNSVDVQPSGRELARDDLILPRRIAQNYNEVDGKFFAKNSARVMFQDKGAQLATSTTDKETIADMVAYARAKQWDSLKLAGSQEFRREAWLQAESQGIKTQGYTPKTADLAALQSLTQERSTNAITPLQERKRDETPSVAPTVQAPRYDLTKNQAVMHAQAVKNLTINMQELQKRPGMENAAVDDLSKLAYWRGMVREENKAQPQTVQDEAVARFDAQATDPQFLKRLNQETSASVEYKTTERVRTQQRDTHGQSL